MKGEILGETNTPRSAQVTRNFLVDSDRTIIHYYYFGIQGACFSNMSEQQRHVISMLFGTAYIPEAMFVFSGESRILAIAVSMVSECMIARLLINGPCKQM